MELFNRRHPGQIYKISFLFAFVTAFTFLTLRVPQDSQAASLANFRPGNIISDYTMSNYTTMSVTDIDAFLHAHGNCNDTNTAKASWYPSLHYHIENDHFVCLADEHFATSGSNYGDLLKDGEDSQTAAEIIYEVSQKYEINPQVFLVLLEKEQGLISDSWPNSIQYSSATCFGCPDTAPCDSEYYGLKNQLESAAWLFRTVLDGGWTNYPLGENYIYYNPNRACGGSVVNIENLATSSLYRYTPYQPNQAALNAGYGTVTCGAYGNRNFYLFFTDWFGDPTYAGYDKMAIPRYMTNIETGETKFYTVKRYTTEGLCLSDNENNPSCTLYSNLKNTEMVWTDMLTSRYLSMNDKTEIIYLSEEPTEVQLADNLIQYFNKKTILPDGRQCLLTNEQNQKKTWCAIFKSMDEVKFDEEEMVFPRLMKSGQEAHFIDPVTKQKKDLVAENEEIFFTKKLELPDGEIYLVSPDHEGCFAYRLLKETWTPMTHARNMVIEKGTYKINAITGIDDKAIYMDKGMVRKYLTKTYREGYWCLRTEYDHSLNTNNCVPDYKLNEVN